MEDENKSSRMRGWNGCTHKEGKLWEIDNWEGGRAGERGREGAVVVEGMTRVPVICLQIYLTFIYTGESIKNRFLFSNTR